jgi:hypothetical protein
MSRSRPVEQNEPLPYNHHLQQFLTFLKQERGFADATIVNRKRSLKPFLAWLIAQDVPLSTVSPVVITKYFISAVAGKWKNPPVLASQEGAGQVIFEQGNIRLVEEVCPTLAV